jgi:hypothetical protein
MIEPYVRSMCPGKCHLTIYAIGVKSGKGRRRAETACSRPHLGVKVKGKVVPLPWLARTLGSWVRIPLKAWMSVFALILCLCCPVCR